MRKTHPWLTACVLSLPLLIGCRSTRPQAPDEGPVPRSSPQASEGGCCCAKTMKGCHCSHCTGGGGPCPCNVEGEKEEWREFVETKVYVEPQGEIEIEPRITAEVPRHGPTEMTLTQEMELGLPYRFQFELYGVEKKTGDKGDFEWDRVKVELRWALAEWGKLPLNPTLYAEWQGVHKDPDRVETKLLLGADPGERWHYGANLVWDHATGGDLDTSYEINQGIAYEVVRDRFSAGVETNFEWHDDKDHRFDIVEQDYLIGPSLLWRPFDRMKVQVSPLFGINDEAPAEKITLVLGWEF